MIQNIKLLTFKNILYHLQLFKWKCIFQKKYALSLLYKKCFYGPFVGEFGHWLGHNLPFIAHLHHKGVKVFFCGMEINKPFLYDNENNLIVNKGIFVRDFFEEVKPDCNTASAPEDVLKKTNNFTEQAKKSIYPYFNNADYDYYFNFFRWWILKKKYLQAYDLSKKYKTKDEDSVVIFPRKWNKEFSTNQLRNNGEIWNYEDLANLASKYFQKVYVIGHPVFSDVNFISSNNIEVHITTDNAIILEKCCNSKLIISQHSGSVYLGEYTNTQILIIYKGGRQIGDIEITKQFKSGLGNKFEFNYAFDEIEVNNYL